ncbi:hypothetical protein, conserved [Leishmania lindenbergi]|uniref:Uncharacterized protein n=1 Tax=Leishmania lindenbergi TaxID=651832 RepID=A0AAW3AGU2_9TRYP
MHSNTSVTVVVADPPSLLGTLSTGPTGVVDGAVGRIGAPMPAPPARRVRLFFPSVFDHCESEHKDEAAKPVKSATAGTLTPTAWATGLVTGLTRLDHPLLPARQPPAPLLKSRTLGAARLGRGVPPAQVRLAADRAARMRGRARGACQTCCPSWQHATVCPRRRGLRRGAAEVWVSCRCMRVFAGLFVMERS